MWCRRLFLAVGCTAFFVSGSASAWLPRGGGVIEPPTKVFKASLNGTNEVPPNNGSGTGAAAAVFNTITRELTWDVEYLGLSSPVKAAGIHGPADPGQDSPAVIRFSDLVTSPIKGSRILTPVEATDLIAAKYYINIQTDRFRAGEIRGQLTSAP